MRKGSLFRFKSTGVVIEYKGNGSYDVLGAVGKCDFGNDAPKAELIYEPESGLDRLGPGSVVESPMSSFVAIKYYDGSWSVSGSEDRISSDELLRVVTENYKVLVNREK